MVASQLDCTTKCHVHYSVYYAVNTFMQTISLEYKITKFIHVNYNIKLIYYSYTVLLLSTKRSTNECMMLTQSKGLNNNRS